MVLSEPELVNQLMRVLRVETGDRIELCDGAGHTAEAIIASIDKKHVVVELAEIVTHEARLARHVTLYAALLKRENFEWVVQKATEVGVAQIVPMLTERTVKQQVRLDRLVKIAREAAEQSGRAWLPTVGEPIALTDAIKHLVTTTAEAWVFDVAAPAGAEFRPTTNNMALFIGPEGGLTDGELTALEAAGAQRATLGHLTLRGETAAVIASYLAVHS